jgi:hypothetical protein
VAVVELLVVGDAVRSIDGAKVESTLGLLGRERASVGTALVLDVERVFVAGVEEDVVLVEGVVVAVKVEIVEGTGISVVE